MTPEDEKAYQRLLAIANFADDEDPAHLVALATNEQDRLLRFATRRRWHVFWETQQRHGERDNS